MRLLSLLSLTLALLTSTIAEDITTLQIDYQTPDITCKRKTKSGDTIQVHYAGTLHSDNSPFDSSYSRQKPLEFQLGAGRVIKGWDEGLKDMCVGEKRKLTVPADMAYGSRAMGPIPANSVLVFETELMGIVGVGKDEL